MSNLTLLDGGRIDQQCNLSKFDHVYLSYQLGLRKPDPAIYQYVTQDLEVSPEQVLFIDDTAQNIQAARDYGWHTCHVSGYAPDLIKRSVDAFLAEPLTAK